MSVIDSTLDSALAQGRRTVAEYYALTKPGIIRGNLLTAAAGFFLAAQGAINSSRFVATLAGLALIIAAGCVCNNFIDRDIDSRMERTRGRALVNGVIGGQQALLYAAILGISGVLLLCLLTNLLTAGLAIFGFLAYVAFYGVAKRRNEHGTVIGSISGAIPPLVGYAAVSGRLDMGALLLFIILVCWQMPHFYAIAIYRSADYAAAGIPVLPLVRGRQATKLQSLAYIVVFTLACVALFAFGYTGLPYLVVSVVLGLSWFGLGLRGYQPGSVTSDVRWAHQMFGFSLLVISLLCLIITIDSF